VSSVLTLGVAPVFVSAAAAAGLAVRGDGRAVARVFGVGFACVFVDAAVFVGARFMPGSPAAASRP
jgi:hypothetical protein